jgi:hypothetical protein
MHNMSCRIFAIFVFLQVPSSLVAAEAIVHGSTQTLWVLGYPVTREGVTRACSIEYNAAGQDYVYKNGALFGIVGNISLSRELKNGQDILVGSLKVILRDYDDKNIDGTPSVPFSIHVVNKSGVSIFGNPKMTFDSDTPGGRVQPYEFNVEFTKIIGSIIEDKMITISFNRRQGGTDINVPLDLTVKNFDPDKGAERSVGMVKSFSDCLGLLLPEG